MFYAHSKQGQSKTNWQTLKDHLMNTGSLAGKFAEKFNASELAYAVGLLHDIGKYSAEFQQRLEGANIRVDHSTPAMKEVFELYPDNKALAKIMAYAICGHHSGLPDAGTENLEGSLEHRKNRAICKCTGYRAEIELPDLEGIRPRLTASESIEFSYFFFIRMIYSCLVDADFLDTESFMEHEKSKERGNYSSIDQLLNLFNEHMQEKTASAGKTKINQYRKQILDNCIERAENKSGFFTLTVPTGGGKTLSSMAFALNHGIFNNMERIIYVIPYTSIIEQNAQVFRDIFGGRNVLEHHSNFQFEDDENQQEISQKLRLASENWDIPVVITTNVQFFESLFANKSSKCRKLHNLSKSVIILDEAQMLPVKYLKACLSALCELVNNYSSTVVLCTATQPNLNNLLPRDMEIKEIVNSPELLYEEFKRTRIRDIGELDDENLSLKLSEHKQVLCIVNSREHARRLYEKLKDGGNVFHLSTKMYPLHRKEVLKKIRKRLQEGADCKVISTQLIEAGVDVDFPVVYRAIAGIDSIIQAAGRCNREGHKKSAEVYVFTSVEEYAKTPRDIEVNISAARSVFRNFEDPLSIEAISKYFELLYDIRNTDQKEIIKDIKERGRALDFPYAQIAHKFKLIEADTISVIVPFNDECRDMIERLKYTPYVNGVLRELQPYIVNLYDNEFAKLMRSGGISAIDKDKGFYAVTDMDRFYDENTGIIVQNDDLIRNVFII